MKKLCLWLALAALLCALTPAIAMEDDEEALVGYILPDGAASAAIEEAGEWPPPEGLESMYELMQKANLDATVYLFKARYGRVLLSVSCAAVSGMKTPEELLVLWPDITSVIGKEVEYLNVDESCASLEEKYGYQALKIKTDIVLNAENWVLFAAEGTAFYQNDDLVEVWLIHPAQSAYLYDEEAGAELESDLSDMEWLMNRLDFYASVQDESKKNIVDQDPETQELEHIVEEKD